MIYSIKYTFINDETLFIVATNEEQVKIYYDRFVNNSGFKEFKVRKE